MKGNIVSIFALLSALCISNVQSLPIYESQQSYLRDACGKLCSKPSWEYTFSEKGSICLCWTDESNDDVNAINMQKQALQQGFTLWIINNATRTKRELTQGSTDGLKEIESTPILQTVTDAKTNINEDEKELKKMTPKKFKSALESPDKDVLPKTTLISGDSILGESLHKSMKVILPPTNRRQSVHRTCSPEITKLALQSVKLHINRLLERADQSNFNCALIIPEFETMKASLQQFINRASERKDLDRSKIFEQFKEREKERQARLHSRLGHFELPKRPSKINLVGAKHQQDKTADDKYLKGEKAKIITQPIDLIDDNDN